MKKLVTEFNGEELRIGGNRRLEASSAPSPLPSRRTAGPVVPALDNRQIAEILDAEDFHVGH
jgi:hypothetical protein